VGGWRAPSPRGLPSFERANLSGADLSGVTGARASFRLACLRASRWHGARLTDLILDGADLSGADLSKATLVLSSASDVIVDDHTRWPGDVVPANVEVRPEPADGGPCE
jgi:uncharacterized protein YjbI with pentapeptide repeats